MDEGIKRRAKQPVSTKVNDNALRGDPLEVVSSSIQQTIERDTKNFKPDTPEADAESKYHHATTPSPPTNHPPVPPPLPSQQTSTSSNYPHCPIRLLKGPPKRKVISATGGITTGKQALEVLGAGASVAHVYTALVYKGVGVIARTKDKMRKKMKRRTKE